MNDGQKTRPASFGRRENEMERDGDNDPFSSLHLARAPERDGEMEIDNFGLMYLYFLFWSFLKSCVVFFFDRVTHMAWYLCVSVRRCSFFSLA